MELSVEHPLNPYQHGEERGGFHLSSENWRIRRTPFSYTLHMQDFLFPGVLVKRFLSERTEQIEDKQIIVLALHAPHFLDATEVSALSSYLGVYSKSQTFLENAVRAIFHNYTPFGAPPISVPT